MMKYKLTKDVHPSTEAFVEARAIKPHPVLTEMARLFKQAYPDDKKVVVDVYFKGVRNITWCPYVLKGFITKTYEVADKIKINMDIFIALIQMYYDVHTAVPERVFNIVSVTIDNGGSSPSFDIATTYYKKFDQGSDGFTNGVTGNKITNVKTASAIDKLTSRDFSPESL